MPVDQYSIPMRTGGLFVASGLLFWVLNQFLFQRWINETYGFVQPHWSKMYLIWTLGLIPNVLLVIGIKPFCRFLWQHILAGIVLCMTPTLLHGAIAYFVYYIAMSGWASHP
ncbi:MAG: hypothetical protein AAGE65_12200 [Planctomycetota bacterium]